MIFFKRAVLPFILAIFLSPMCASAQKIATQGTSIDAAFIEAKKQKKLILVDFFTDWCLVCHRMQEEVIEQPEMQAFLNPKFVSVHLNGDNFASMDIADAIGGIDAYPTYVVLNEKGMVVGKMVGYYAQEPLLSQLSTFIYQDEIMKKRELAPKQANKPKKKKA